MKHTVRIVGLSSFLLLFPLLALADQFTGFQNPLSSNSVFDIINNVTAFLQPFAAAVVVIMILVGAFQILTGNPSQITTGRKTILWAVIGFAIIFLTPIIIGAIQEFFK
ncbi:MAG: hypothetical protein KGI50_03780 [Patescibacteria group bacterium]|nr:hypothetical protein [Patescibacteria group bacterium]MDE2438409.1 hypothetical protein [Patescibacteria group bacterium]